MVKHIVVWKCKEFAAGNDKITNMQMAKELLEDLKGKVPSLNSIEVGINFNQTDSASDMVLYSEFDNEQGLNAYQLHEEHQKIGAFISSIVENRIVVDYRV